MRMIPVYQCELDRSIPLEYIGTVKYVGPYDPSALRMGRTTRLSEMTTGGSKSSTIPTKIIFMICPSRIHAAANSTISMNRKEF